MLIRLLQLLNLYGVAKRIKDWLVGIHPGHIRHRQDLVRFYSQFVDENDLCFDVGANLGDRTDLFLQLGARVVAVDPQDICVQKLAKRYGSNNKVKILQTALGAEPGEAEMMICDAHTVSSLSKDWIDSVRSSGRFSAYRWTTTKTVPVTTLDRLIEQHGKPAFCKIDVEGFESHVLRGLSQPIKTISFEFTPEFIESALDSIDHLATVGPVCFNYSVGESARLTLSDWVGSEEMRQILVTLPDKTIFGDVYARFE